MQTREEFPRAIVHFDGDSFFASVEQVLDYRLRGKPVVTGGERGCATALSYEAKRRGATRGMTMRKVKALVPDVVILPGNYTAYSIFAKRMYRIAERFTPVVEEYSIDECFADITGLAKEGMPYETIARNIKEALESDLGITFGVGLAPTKTLAKIASSKYKPAGFTTLPHSKRKAFLADVPIAAVWGVGFSTALRLEGLGIMTALDFAEKDADWLRENKISKPYKDLWNELNGRMTRPVEAEHTSSPQSVIKSRTFRATNEKRLLVAELANNLEAACAKLRRHGMKARYCRFYLKTQSFTYAARILDLGVPHADPTVFLQELLKQFDAIRDPSERYRATGIGLYGLVRADALTPDLFGKSAGIETHAPLIAALDRLNGKYGHHTVHLAESLPAAHTHRRPHGPTLSIEKRKKTLAVPYLGVAR